MGGQRGAGSEGWRRPQRWTPATLDLFSEGYGRFEEPPRTSLRERAERNPPKPPRTARPAQASNWAEASHSTAAPGREGGWAEPEGGAAGGGQVRQGSRKPRPERRPAPGAGLTPVPGAGRVGGPIPEGMSGGEKPAAGGIARGQNWRPKGDAGTRTPPSRGTARGTGRVKKRGAAAWGSGRPVRAVSSSQWSADEEPPTLLVPVGPRRDNGEISHPGAPTGSDDGGQRGW
ncbi:translation initiation factor IF-2-like [Aquila chrysaetos chrysaetos]|uniref:translation initiation factor IF-2-like n=1 Tax=Aquila chrysaetos chrysaetos TaxID=223781 RepID=UPI001176F12A|nr:translation initiation factor IF-2-like [Aquila chrysaetos chrysaetos]